MSRGGSPEQKIVDHFKDTQVRLFRKIFNALLCAIFDEYLIIFNWIGKKFAGNCGSTIRKTKYETFRTDDDGKYAEEFKKSRVKLRPSASADDEEDIPVALRKIMHQLWNCSLDKQFSDTWSKVIKFISDRLPPDWTDAVRDGELPFMLVKLASCIPKDGIFRYELKSVLPLYYACATIAVRTWKLLIGKLRTGICEELEISEQYTPYMLEFIVEFLVTNWGVIIEQFYHPRSFVDISALQSGNLLALRAVFVGFCADHCDSSTLKSAGLNNLIESLVDIDYYQLRSQIARIKLPAYMRRLGDEIENVLYEPFQQLEDHISRKSNIYGVSFGAELFNKHKKYYLSILNTAQYKDNMGIESELVRRGSLEKSIGAAINNYIGSSKGKTKAQKQAIIDTINNLVDGKYDSKAAEYKLGLSLKVSDLVDERLVYLYVFCFVL